MYWSMRPDWGDHMFDLHQISWLARIEIEYLSNNTSWYIIDFIEFHTKYLPPAYPIEMTDQYGVTPEEYANDLKSLSNARYSQGMSILFYRSRSNVWGLKSLSLLWCYMILSIIFTNRWDFLFISNDLTYLSSPLLGWAPPQACFPFDDQLLPLTYENSGGSGQNCMSYIFLSW